MSGCDLRHVAGYPGEVTEEETPETSTLARLEQRLLGARAGLSIGDLAARLGVSVERVLTLWQPFGSSEDLDAEVLTEYDVEVLARLLEATERSTVSPEVSAQMVRSVGHLTDRLAVWQLEALVEHVARTYRLDDASARLLLLDRLADAVPLLQEQLVHAWRRQLLAHARRIAAQVVDSRTDGEENRLPRALAVGFADVVSFTARTAGMTADELAAFVQGFETRARDVVMLAGGRVVKTLGDAVFFVADDPRHGAAVALSLAQEFHASGPTPVRVGLVWGYVLSRYGDVYGLPVNLAARLTAAAEPGTVLTDEATAGVLAEDEEVRLVQLEERELPGLGPVRPVQVEPAVSPAPGRA